MKFYVYFLKSLKNEDLYVGSTANLEERVGLHNRGKVKSTKAYRSWRLLGFREYNSRSEAFRAEKFFKNHQQKEILKEKYGGMAKG